MPRPLPRKIEESEIVFTGKVEDVVLVSETSHPVNDEPPLIKRIFVARLNVTGFLSRKRSMVGYSHSIIFASFLVINDRRYSGEAIPRLEQGKSYTLFGRYVAIREDGFAEITLARSDEAILNRVE